MSMGGMMTNELRSAKQMGLRPHVIPAEHFAATINQLKGKVSMMFITHAMPKNLLVDDVVRIGQGTLSAVGDAHDETKKEVAGGVHG